MNNYIHQVNSEVQQMKPDLEKIKTLLIKAFEEENKSFYDEKNKECTDKLDRWINSLIGSGTLNFIKKTPIFIQPFYSTLSNKVSFIAQQPCLLCTEEFPIKTIPIRIRPESYQSIDAKLKEAYKFALHEWVKEKGFNDFSNCRICLQLLFICSQNRSEKDVDNMAKLVLDALKDALFGDDKNVDHLSIYKFMHLEEEEFIYINIRKSKLNKHIDTLINEFHHNWGSREMIDLIKYIK